MREAAFDKPVRVTLGPAGSVAHIVTTPIEAAEKMLGKEWPVAAGKTQRAARAAVLRAMENALDATLAAKARAAFEAAAEDAGILMEPMERPIGGKSFKWGTRKR